MILHINNHDPAQKKLKERGEDTIPLRGEEEEEERKARRKEEGHPGAVMARQWPK